MIKGEIKKFWPEALHIIADNSSDSAVADKIKQISGGTVYIKVPNNPFALSESHGAALNWVCKNVVGKLPIRYVGFLDHDCFPIKRSYVIDVLRKQGFYELK